MASSCACCSTKARSLDRASSSPRSTHGRFRCSCSRPISGRLGLRLVDPGNIVRAGDTNGLVVITQLEPAAVVFTVPQDLLPAVMKRLQSGDQIPVEAWDREQKAKLAAGTLASADNQVDPQTGT